jgi:hypothetical protein
MNWQLLVALIIAEVIAIVAIAIVWRRRKMRWPAKLCWTLVLFVPVLGVLFYGLLSVNPKPHGETPIDTIGAD